MQRTPVGQKKNPLIEKKFERNFKILRTIPQNTEDASSWTQDLHPQSHAELMGFADKLIGNITATG